MLARSLLLLLALAGTAAAQAPFVSPEIDTTLGAPRGFDAGLAAQLAQLCMDLNNRGTADPAKDQGAWRYQATTTGWTSIYPPNAAQPAPVIGGLDNAWRLWRRDGTDTYALVVRGTEENRDSIVDDALVTTVPVNPALLEVYPDHRQLAVWLARGSAGAPAPEAHLGFLAAMTTLTFADSAVGKEGVLHEGILHVLRRLTPALGGKVTLLITGHSQGAAIATLEHAFLHYALNRAGDPFQLAGGHFVLRSIVFAQPKPGNAQFALDFARIAGGRGASFTVTNTADVVTTVPLSLQSVSEVSDYLAGDLKDKFLNTALKTFDRLDGDLRRVIAGLVERDVETNVRSWGVLDPKFCDFDCVDGRRRSGTSLNYATAGEVVPLIGPAPIVYRHDADHKDADDTDALYQHHLYNYIRLLNGQVKSNCTPAGDCTDSPYLYP
jgi:hypothetical protein